MSLDVARIALLALAAAAACKSPTLTLGTASTQGAHDVVRAAADTWSASAASKAEAVPDKTVDAAAATTNDSETDGSAAPDAKDKCAKFPLKLLVLAGEKCEIPGALRCSNEAARTMGVDALSIEGVLRCNRPNALKCQPDAQGSLRWQLVACQTVLHDLAPDLWQNGKCAQGSTCIELDAEAKCVPWRITSHYGDNWDPTRPTDLCLLTQVGLKTCNGDEQTSVCTKVSGGQLLNLPKTNPPGALATCLPFAEGGAYWIPIENCYLQEFKNCPKIMQSTYGKCSIQSDGETRCDKDCAEALKPVKYWSP